MCYTTSGCGIRNFLNPCSSSYKGSPAFPKVDQPQNLISLGRTAYFVLNFVPAIFVSHSPSCFPLSPYPAHTQSTRTSIMALLLRLLPAALLASSCHALVAFGRQELHPGHPGLPAAKRADPNLAGYLGAFFLGDVPSVYFYTSKNDNANALTALNSGNPVLVPTTGTGGVRDPTIVAGGGVEAGQKWYILGTDLDIGKVSSFFFFFLSFSPSKAQPNGKQTCC